ncbi:MAG: hypothetical protein HDT09_00680 [Bacteroidales bacterium]|nr:hypothetical protein [Bacteroidales bacterium]
MDENQDVDVMFKISEEIYEQYKTRPGDMLQKVRNILKDTYTTTKAMTMLYKLEKATLEMTSVMHVKDLAKRFEAQWLQQLNQP